jgi:hypothetical protein
VIGAERGIAEANRGSDIRIPAFFGFIIRYACPAYLLIILGGFVYQDIAREARAVAGDAAALTTAIFMVTVLALFLVLVLQASRRWEQARRFDRPLDGGPP